MSTSVGKPRIVVAMSGGVDSSLAAVLMKEMGYDVIGVTIKTYDYEDIGGNDNRDSSCCSIDGINMARSVADRQKFPHYVFDFSERFKHEVIDEFVGEYLAGRTPNPCVVCNRKIKWEYLLEKAESLGAAAICTGHYAGVRFDYGLKRYILSRGKDSGKDQSYALYGLTQESLSKTIFPLSQLSKAEVRLMAMERGLASAKKPESYEICFVADNDYTRFLRDAVPGLDRRIDGGEIIYNGKTVGRHRGYAFYTIGQRRGLGISSKDPLYVKNIDPERNTIEVDVESGLYGKALKAERVNLIKYSELPNGRVFKAKIRYKDPGAECLVKQTGPAEIEVEFLNPRRAITLGQSVVLYERDDVVAGGVVSQVMA
jgi:tRNA-specific 2-thiouridylase